MGSNETNYQLKTIEKLAFAWDCLATRLPDEDFDYEKFIYLFNKTYSIFAYFSTRSFIDRALLGLYNSVQTFFYEDGGFLLEHACKTIAMTMAQDTILPCEPCNEPPKGTFIRAQGKEIYIDYTDIKGSVARYMEFVELD